MGGRDTFGTAGLGCLFSVSMWCVYGYGAMTAPQLAPLCLIVPKPLGWFFNVGLLLRTAYRASVKGYIAHLPYAERIFV